MHRVIVKKYFFVLQISEEYSGVYFDNGELVVYVDYSDDNAYIYVKNIFDKEITVEHAKGENYDTIVETFNLG